MIYHKEKITVSKVNINEIPTIFIEDEAGSATLKPIVFMFHRLLEDKEYELSINYKLARLGFFVIGIDMYGHGERRVTSSSKYNFNNLVKDSYMTVCDIPSVLGFLEKEMSGKLDFDNIGAIGISNGANIALMAGHLYQEIKYAVSIIGVINWENIIQRSSFNFFKHFSLHPEVMDIENVLSDVLKYEPINKYNENNLIPILFLNGNLDTTMPPRALQDYYNQFRAIFTSCNRQNELGFMGYPNAGHEVTNDMITDLVIWIRNLFK